LPFCGFACRIARPGPVIPSEIKHLGDHLLKRQIETGWTWKAIGKAIGVGATNVANWRQGRREPGLRQWPKIIAFLGYDPRPPAEGVGPALVAWRQGRGLSQRELAARLEVDPSTLAKWERGERMPKGPHRLRTDQLLSRR
jgi:transcriptional regulator with XRE-family HTH domain